MLHLWLRQVFRESLRSLEAFGSLALYRIGLPQKLPFSDALQRHSLLSLKYLSQWDKLTYLPSSPCSRRLSHTYRTTKYDMENSKGYQ